MVNFSGFSPNKTYPKQIIKMKSIIVIALILAFYVYSCMGTCTNCGPNDGCCNDLNNNGGRPTCYNKATHQCNNGNRLCPLNFLSCGLACYSPASYQCNSGNKLCPVNFLSCGDACYSPSQYACVNGQLVNQCVPGACGQLLCCPVNGGCYNPNHFACTNEGLFVRCFGIPSNDPTVCNGHGTCNGLDICVCRDGYTGPNCFVPPP